jgi:NADH-quinone oxidoreductase subunit G
MPLLLSVKMSLKRHRVLRLLCVKPLRARLWPWPPPKKLAHGKPKAVLNIAQHERSPIFLANLAPSRLDDIATATTVGTAAAAAQLAFAVAHAIDSNAPTVSVDTDTQTLATRIAESLLAAERPLIVAGTSAGDIGTLDAALNICRALKARGKSPSISLTLPEVNSLGLALIDAQAARSGAGID